MRGRAIGLFGVAFPFAPAILIPAAQWMMDTWGWRSVFWGAGLAVTLLVTLPALLLLRRRPEDVGLYPDGAEGPADLVAGGRRRRGGDNNFTATEAMRTPTFWFLVGSQFLGVFISGSVSFHLAAYLGDVGIATAVIGLAISLYSITNGLSSGLWGYLSERISERYIGMGATALGGVIALLLMGVNGPLVAVVLTALYGLGVRGGNSTLGLIIAQYYGRQSYGAINGTLVPIGYVGLGIGPLIGSMLYDASHNYSTFLWMLVALHALNVVFFGLALPPRLPARLANAPTANQP